MTVLLRVINELVQSRKTRFVSLLLPYRRANRLQQIA